MNNIQEGGCVCGQVRFRTSGEPTATLACHCKFCQRRSGSAFAITVYVAEAAFELLCGIVETHEHRSDESGRWIRTEFCPKCGTTIGHTAELRPGQRAVAGGTYDDPGCVKIKQHIWVGSKRDWVIIPSEFKPK